MQDRLDFSKGQNADTDCQVLESMIDGCVSVSHSTTAQDLNGIDYIAQLRGGAELFVDAKTRDKGCSKFWKNDRIEIALEVWSVMPEDENDSGTVGWTLCETKSVDLILFKFHPDDTQRVFLFSFQHLRMAFRRNCRRWISQYKVDIQRSTHNGQSWRSKCVFVPVKTVEKAIREVRRAEIEFEDEPCPKTKDLFGKPAFSE